MRSVCVILISLIWQITVYGQQQEDAQAQIEHIMSAYDESDNQSYFETLMHYYQNPIDLNKCNAADLASLGILSLEQVQQFIAYRDLTVTLNSIYELQAIQGFDLTTIRYLLPFVTITKKEGLGNQLKGLWQSNNSYLLGKYTRVIETKSGYENGVYIGDPSQAQLRLRLLSPGHISAGLTVQKDPGELLFNKNGPDFLSGHIYIQNDNIINQLAVGDYKLQYGQGLLLGSGFLIGKNAETITSVKQGTIGVMPYSSVTEYNFFRGAATRLNLTKNLTASLFYSRRHLDASLSRDSTITTVTSIRSTGLHRTQSEIEGKNLQKEQVLGGVLSYSGKRFKAGAIALNTQYALPLIPTSTVYNQYYFSGNRLANFSLFGEYNGNNFVIFIELAKSIQGGFGWTAGLIASLSSRVDFSMLGRSLSRDFHSLYGAPFSEQSTARNESGIYWGLKIRPAAKFEISLYFDLYEFPWLTSSVSAPSHGKEIMGRFNYKLNQSSQIFIQVKSEQREGKDPSYTIPKSINTQYLKTLVNFDYNLETPLQFRTRIQWNQTKVATNHSGMLIYQDINYVWQRFSLTTRFLLFDADNLARLYTYERDVLFSFSTPSFAGEGLHYYLMIKYKPIRNLSFRGKIGQTVYFDREFIGSGNELINDQHKTQVTFQMKLNF